MLAWTAAYRPTARAVSPRFAARGPIVDLPRHVLEVLGQTPDAGKAGLRALSVCLRYLKGGAERRRLASLPAPGALVSAGVTLGVTRPNASSLCSLPGRAWSR